MLYNSLQYLKKFEKKVVDILTTGWANRRLKGETSYLGHFKKHVKIIYILREGGKVNMIVTIVIVRKNLQAKN